MHDVVIDIAALYATDGANKTTAKLANLPRYLKAARDQAGQGNRVTLTGPGPVWLYLAVAHELHGLATELCYDSPTTGSIIIFDHAPY